MLRTMICLSCHVAKMYPSLKVTMHLYGKAAFNEMLKLPNIDLTPFIDIHPKKWKGMNALETELDEAEKALVKDPDDEGFTKKQLLSAFDPRTEEVVVEIEPLVF